jgi:hypothetical protein
MYAAGVRAVPVLARISSHQGSLVDVLSATTALSSSIGAAGVVSDSSRGSAYAWATPNDTTGAIFSLS